MQTKKFSAQFFWIVAYIRHNSRIIAPIAADLYEKLHINLAVKQLFYVAARVFGYHFKLFTPGADNYRLI